MKLKKRGRPTSIIELHTSRFGLWLLVHDMEYFLSYKDYPWFADAKLSDLYAVTLLRGHHLRWDALDIDLELESLKHPERYPLIYSESNQRLH